MSFKLIIPGADFSGLGNPKVESYIEGFPADGLSALYLLQDGMVGQAFAGEVQDSSGNEHHAALIANSQAHQVATGLANVASPGDPVNRGFGALSPVEISDRFTIFGISRDLFPATSGVSVYAMPWLSSGNATPPLNPDTNAFGQVNRATDGVLGLNHFTNGTTVDYANIGLYAATTADTGWQGATRLGIVAGGSGSKANFVPWALSFDKDVGATLRAGGVTVTAANAVSAALWASQQKTRNAQHVFGFMTYIRDTDCSRGELGLAGIYDGVAKSVADMDRINAASVATILGRE